MVAYHTAPEMSSNVDEMQYQAKQIIQRQGNIVSLSNQPRGPTTREVGGANTLTMLAV